jgi:AcrR family transcriptional regulator
LQDRARTVPDADPRALADETAAPPRRGRPRNPTTDTTILRATIELLTEVGVPGTTTDAIVERSGCSKATIYRRWPTRDALIMDAFRIAVRGQPDDVRAGVELERELGSTIHAAALRGMGIFNSQLFRSVFPTIARELLAGSETGEKYRADVFYPIRIAARARLAEAIEREEIAPTVEADLLFDLLYGGLLYRILVGEPVDEEIARAMADLAMTGAAGRRYRERTS